MVNVLSKSYLSIMCNYSIKFPLKYSNFCRAEFIRKKNDFRIMCTDKLNWIPHWFELITVHTWEIKNQL